MLNAAFPLVSVMRRYRTACTVIAGACAVTATFALISLATPKPPIPIPFLSQDSSGNLAGTVTYIRTLANGVEFYEMDFTDNTRQTAAGDKVYLIKVSAGVTQIPFEQMVLDANGATRKYYGYIYTSINATTEIANANAAAFATRFPGKFFASAAALAAHGGDLNSFATLNGITFLSAGAGRNDNNGVFLKTTLIALVPIDQAMFIDIAPKCGNAWLASAEGCDDGNTAAADGCSSTCVVETGFTCSGDPSVCSGPAVCGNGLLQTGEVCDDGDTDSGDGCSATCGVETGFTCDTGSPTVCTPDPACGDGFEDQGETCDDGNTSAGDGCSATCTTETGFTCNQNVPNVCTPFCGDGVRMVAGGGAGPSEECDDGNGDAGDGCSDTCTIEDGFTCTNDIPGVCTPICGNGVLDGNEECDDGDNGDGDGCSATCEVEAGFTCTGEPSVCAASPGTLFVKKSTTATKQRNQYLGGVLGDTALRLTFTADDHEDIAIRGIDIASVVDPRSIDRIELYLVGGTQPIGNATIAGCGATAAIPDLFCASLDADDFVVPKSQSVDLLLQPRLKADVDGGVSGDPLKLSIPGTTETQTAGLNRFAIRAIGVTTQSELFANDEDAAVDEGEVFIGSNIMENITILGSEHVVVMAKIASVIDANPDRDGTAIPTGASNIGIFKFTAASNINTQNGLNTFDLTDILFTVNANNVNMNGSSFEFLNTADPGTTTACEAFEDVGQPQTGFVTGTFFVICDGIDQSLVENRVASGEEQTFALRGSVNAIISAAQESTLQVVLDQHNEPAETAFGIADSHIRWHDTDAVTLQEFFFLDLADDIASTLYGDAGPVCGNGDVETGEGCDDSNTAAGDGCSATCTVETGFSCSGEPSVCSPIVCGNGVRETGETCDDGNTTAGDGCTDTCSVESGYVCYFGTPGNPDVCYLLCEDTDGSNIMTAGEVIEFGVSHTKDACDNNPLAEYLMHEQVCRLEGQDTDVWGCPVGTTCEENAEGMAACVPGGPAPSGGELNCTDTDGGFNLGVAGNASNPVQGAADADICTGFTSIQEVYCERPDGDVVHLSVPCPTGQTCTNGACQ